MTIPAYPLSWPHGWKRIPSYSRATARFVRNGRQLSIAEAVDRVRAELVRMSIRDDDMVISSNLLLRMDGLPRSGQPEPSDPGVCVYWQRWNERAAPPKCMAIDRYDRVADNLAAIAATLDAMRAIERHGGATVLERAFTGFTALESAETEHWAVVLGVPATATFEVVQATYRRLRGEAHPDAGGSASGFDRVQKAWERFQRDVGVGGAQ